MTPPTPTLLRRLRLERGMSARDLAARCGVSHPTILAYENGRTRRGRPRNRARLAAVMGLPIDMLLMPDPNADGRAEARPSEVATTRDAHPATTEGGASIGG